MQQRNTRNGGGLHNMGRAMLIMTIVGIAALIIFNFARGGFQKSSIGDLITGANVPKGLQIAYVPVEFKPDIDEENALAVLSNPERYRREFDQLIYDFNLQLLQHVGRRMDLPDSLYTRLEVEYKKHHQYLKDLYFNDFIVLRDTTAGNYEQWYNNESGGAVEALKEVSSKYVCFFVNQIILTLVGAEGGKLSVKGKDVETPCAIALNEALQPLTKRLQERAAIDDFAKSKGLLQEKVESVISELATMEVRDKKGLSKALSTKVLGFDVSSTNVEISAMSILKVGFKLDNYFDIELSKGNKEVVVTLPEPTILSHEVYPKVDKLDVGWLRELNNSDFNSNFNLLRSEFRREAMESDIMDKSKTQVKDLMQLMMSPMLQSLGRGYKLKIKFVRSGLSTTDEHDEKRLLKLPEKIQSNKKVE